MTEMNQADEILKRFMTAVLVSVSCTWCVTSVTVVQSYHKILLCLLKLITLYSVLYFSVGKATRGEGENTGVDEEKELCAIVNLFPQELEGT
jgi:hypothetical protein